MTDTIPDKPTPAMRRFLQRLLSAGGERPRIEMGFPAYPMPLKMERAGWITCTYGPGATKSQLWGYPRAYRITEKGRAIMAPRPAKKAKR